MKQFFMFYHVNVDANDNNNNNNNDNNNDSDDNKQVKHDQKERRNVLKIEGMNISSDDATYHCTKAFNYCTAKRNTNDEKIWKESIGVCKMLLWQLLIKYAIFLFFFVDV